MTPTEYGALLLDHFSKSEAEMRQAGQNLASLSRKKKGAVTCGSVSASMPIVAAAAQEFETKEQFKALHLIEGTTPDLLKLLKDHEVDIVIGSESDEETSEGLVVEKLHDEELGVFARSGHPALSKPSNKLQDLLNDYQFVFPDDRTQVRAMLSSALQIAGLETPSRLIETHSAAAMRWFSERSDYLVVSTSVVQMQEIIQGSIHWVKTDLPLPKFQHVLYRRPRHSGSAAIVDFAKAIKTQARSLNRQAIIAREAPKKG